MSAPETEEEAPLVEPGTFQFDDGYLLLEPELVDHKIRRKALSASTMNALVGRSVCLARFAAEKTLPRKEDPFGVAETGTMAHSVLEAFYALPPDKRTYQAAEPLLEEVLAKSIPESRFGDSTEATRDLVRPKVLAGFETIFDIETPSEVDVFALESPIKWGTEINGIPVVGFIDRVDNLDNGGLRVIDYKSGKVKSPGYYGDPHGDQTRLYKLAKEAELGVEVSEAKLYYTAHSKSRNVNIDDKHMKKTAAKMKRAWDVHEEMVETAEFKLTPSPLCGWCPLVNICPGAQAAGKEAKIAAPTPVQLGADIPVRASLSEGENAAQEARENTTNESEATVATKKKRWPEEKPWKAEIGGRLQPASYSATAVMGLATRAFSDMTNHNLASGPDEAVSIDRQSITALADTYAFILAEAQTELAGKLDWQAGLNTRLRSAMFTCIEKSHAIPFGKSLEEWDAWVDRVIESAVMLINVGEDIYTGDAQIEDHDPWERLAEGDVAESREVRQKSEPAETDDADDEADEEEVEAEFED